MGNFKKIIIIITAILIVIFSTSCNKQQETKLTIPESGYITKLPLEINNTPKDDIEYATEFFSTYAKDLNLYAYLMDDTTIMLVNNLEGEINPYEELTYSATDNKREIKYRYLCYDDFSKFDKDLVCSQVETIFGIDLKQNYFDDTIDRLNELVIDLDNEMVLPMSIDTGYDISVVVGIAKNNNQIFLSVVVDYIALQE